jgi:hypothetical protein
MRHRLATLGAVLAVFAASAGTAFAAGPVQSTTQSAATGQGAIAASGATQVQPTNTAYSVRVLSPGNDGAVTQSNTASSSATAANAASTTQGASQTQAAGCGCSGDPLQAITQGAQSGQISGVLSGAAQLAAANGADPASVASPGGGGSTQQSNDATSAGSAANSAPTAQDASQAQSGGGTQAATQAASTEQAAGAASSAAQYKPSNTNVSVRVLSPGDGGDVSQSNDASSTATAANTAGTTQNAPQTQSGGGGVQSATQAADTQQKAGALSQATQVKPSNSNISVRVLSPGNDGAVTQSNDASSSATATNTAPVAQTASQDQRGSSCGCGGGDPSVQAIGQKSSTGQAAGAASKAEQIGASNTNDPVRVWSPGGAGSVTQSNTTSSDATAANDASTKQAAGQAGSSAPCGCDSGLAVQAIGQKSSTGQLAGAASGALQVGASNTSDPVRVWSPGDDGSVSQSNDASSSATAANSAATGQHGDQYQAGSGIQALGQDASTWQGASALSAAAQLPGHESCGCKGSSSGNTADPVRIGSKGNGGSVTQSNAVSSTASAPNTASTYQSGWQGQSGSKCGCGGLGIQALGQQAATEQLGAAYSEVWQWGASNTSRPTAIWSWWGEGPTRQLNGASSSAAAPNAARTVQMGAQME